MIAIHSNKLNHHIDFYKARIDEHIEEVRVKIKDWLDTPDLLVGTGRTVKLSANQKKYLQLIKRDLDKIVIADYEVLVAYQKKFDDIITENERSETSKYFTSFKNTLLKIMGYSDLRSTYTNDNNPLYVDFYQNFGIKTCAYCNSQLTIVAKEVTQSLRARFQIDHFIDKSSYPCFSISFFNLYPVCASCNNKKGVKEVGFQLYSSEKTDLQKSAFHFSLDRESISKFRISGDEAFLKIFFNDNNSKLNEIFAVEGIYETQQDLAAEMILKAEIYNESYKDALRDSFDKLYGKKGKHVINFNRIILGNYTDAQDIHKRPLAKFTQDIAKQLKLI